MYYYIVNPAAGGGTVNSIQEKLKANLRHLKIDGEFAKTLGEGDASQITKKALDKGVKTIVAVGGNSTVNEVITAVFRQQKSDVAIGIIPTGKQNTLASSLGVHNWRQAAEVLAARRLTEYSLMTIDDHVFVHSVDIHPPIPSDEQDRSAGRWGKLLASRAESKPLAFRATLDDELKFRGEASHIEAYNQKFLSPANDNQLLIRIYGVGPAGNLATRLGSLLGRPEEGVAGGVSQLHGRNLAIKSQRLAEATLDGRALSGKQFDVALTDWQLRLITNLSSQTN